MAFDFAFHHDASLTTEISSGNPLAELQDSDLTLTPVAVPIYFGSLATSGAFKVEAFSDPGTDPIVVSVVDADAGTGAPVTEFKLALSEAGLTTAVAGDPLEIGTSVLSGTANKITIWTLRTTAITTVGVYTDITLETNLLVESAV